MAAGRPRLPAARLIRRRPGLSLAAALLLLAAAAAAADLPEPDDFYRLWGDLQVKGGTAGQVEADLRTVLLLA